METGGPGATDPHPKSLKTSAQIQRQIKKGFHLGSQRCSLAPITPTCKETDSC